MPPLPLTYGTTHLMAVDCVPADRAGLRLFAPLLTAFLLSVSWAVMADTHSDSGAAYAHCYTESVAAESCYNSWKTSQGSSYYVTFLQCIATGTPSSSYVGRITINGGTAQYGFGNANSFGSSGCVSQSHDFPPGSDCSTASPVGPLDSSYGASDVGKTSCLNGCTFQFEMWCGDGGVGLCAVYGFPTGFQCTPGAADGTGNDTPDGCTRDANNVLTCDCVNNPTSWFCTEYPGGSDPGDGSCTGEHCAPTGDGDGGGTDNPNNPDDGTGGGTGCNGEADANGDGYGDVTGTLCSGDGGGGGGGDNPPPSGSPGGDICTGSPPTCSNGSAECAMLLQAWQLDRNIYCGDEPGAPWDLPEGTVDPFSPEAAETVDLSGQTFDTSGAGGGACPASPVLSVAGVAYDFDLGPLCSFAETMRPLIIAATLLLAALYVFRGS